MVDPNLRPAVQASPLRMALVIFLVSAAVRLALLQFVPLDPAFTMRWETAKVANQLLQTGEYANPYFLPTGPTAHAVPFHTSLMVIIFSVFGAGMAAEYARCGVTILSYSVMYALLPWFGLKLGLGLRAGFMGGLIGALNPLHFQTGISGGIGEEFAAISLGLLMVLSLAAWQTTGWSLPRWFMLGCAWGAAFHVSPVLLSVLVAFVLFDLMRSGIRLRWGQFVLLAAGVVLVCVPWTYRNYKALNGFVFIRSNFGLELRMGNHPGVAPTMEQTDRLRPGLHPITHREEALKVAELGELAYMRRSRDEAINWIAANPGEFARLTFSRFATVWLGPSDDLFAAAISTILTLLAFAGAWRAWPLLTSPERAALFLPLMAFPAIYYVLAYMLRYRIPVDWIVMLLAGSAISNWIRRQGAPGGDCDMI